MQGYCTLYKTCIFLCYNIIHLCYAYTAEPHDLVLTMDGVVTGRMHLGPGAMEPNVTNQEVDVTLGHTYKIDCEVTGGNPFPNVTLVRGNVPYQETFQDVELSYATERDERDSMSVPIHTVNARLDWTPTVDDIGRPFTCSAGVEMFPRPISTIFVPLVTDSKPYRHSSPPLPWVLWLYMGIPMCIDMEWVPGLISDSSSLWDSTGMFKLVYGRFPESLSRKDVSLKDVSRKKNFVSEFYW